MGIEFIGGHASVEGYESLIALLAGSSERNLSVSVNGNVISTASRLFRRWILDMIPPQDTFNSRIAVFLKSQVLSLLLRSSYTWLLVIG